MPSENTKEHDLASKAYKENCIIKNFIKSTSSKQIKANLLKWKKGLQNAADDSDNVLQNQLDWYKKRKPHLSCGKGKTLGKWIKRVWTSFASLSEPELQRVAKFPVSMGIDEAVKKQKKKSDEMEKRKKKNLLDQSEEEEKEESHQNNKQSSVKESSSPATVTATAPPRRLAKRRNQVDSTTEQNNKASVIVEPNSVKQPAEETSPEHCQVCSLF